MGIESYTGDAKSAIGAAYGLYESCQLFIRPESLYAHFTVHFFMLR